jgi:NTP pyrophosphatase (non-canonical NTP hydrolase)
MDLPALTEKALALREQFNADARRQGRREWTREEVMQGFVVDVGALMKLVMARNGARPVADLERKLGHELADCLWSVLVLARLYDVDLERELLAMLEGATARLGAPRTP